MGALVESRPRRTRAVAAAAGLVALVPAALLVAGGVAEFAVPPILASPVLVLGGVAIALLVNVGARVRFRSDCTPDAVHVECDVRLDYRGANRTVILVAGGLGAAILLLLVALKTLPVH
jgi:hypothetical protein